MLPLPGARFARSKTKGAWLDFNFTGTDVAWISSKGPNFGKAKVYVDDVLVQKVDLWASSAAARRVAFAVSGLAPGAHKLTIVVLGTKLGRGSMSMGSRR